jgi:hypothetical protein
LTEKSTIKQPTIFLKLPPSVCKRKITSFNPQFSNQRRGKMKIIKTALLSLFCLSTVSYAYDTEYLWFQHEGTSHSECGEAQNGRFVRWVDNNYCRTAWGTHYLWFEHPQNNHAECGEATPKGAFVGWVDDNFCRTTVGTVYRWYDMVPTHQSGCAELSPSQHFIRWMPNYYCR